MLQMTVALLPMLDSVLIKRGLAQQVSSAFFIRKAKIYDVFALLRSFKPLLDSFDERANGLRLRVTLVDETLFRRDVAESSLAEIFALRLLMPYVPLVGEAGLREMEIVYKANIVQSLLRDIVLDHKLAALELRVKPEYFLYEKIRKTTAVFPPLRQEVWEAFFGEDYQEKIRKSISGFEAAAETLCREGVIEKDEDTLRLTMDGYNRFQSRPGIVDPRRVEEAIRKFLSWPSVSRASIKTTVDTLSRIVHTPPLTLDVKFPEPGDFLFVRTASGVQPLSEQLDIREMVKHLFAEKETDYEIRRVGGALNSAYLLTFPRKGNGSSVFVKKYLNWTDFKWVVARIWALGIKNFSLSAATRMATEIFFLNSLRDYGFDTPDILHVNWRKKILFLRYVEGTSLLEAWTGKHAERKRFARDAGTVLAKIHGQDVTIGDCKPDSFIMSMEGVIYVTDLEQAAHGGDKAWDVTELILYPGHYLSSNEAADMASATISGYLTAGEVSVVEDALQPRYLRALIPWTSPSVQKAIVDAVRRETRA